MRIVGCLINYCFLTSAKRRREWPGCADRWNYSPLAPRTSQLPGVGITAPLSRSMRPCGGGVNGGVMIW
jgi:hypothetical protein